MSRTFSKTRPWSYTATRATAPWSSRSSYSLRGPGTAREMTAGEAADAAIRVYDYVLAFAAD